MWRLRSSISTGSNIAIKISPFLSVPLSITLISEWVYIDTYLLMNCRRKSRMTLSIKQLEQDPLLETLDKVIPQVNMIPVLLCMVLRHFSSSTTSKFELMTEFVKYFSRSMLPCINRMGLWELPIHCSLMMRVSTLILSRDLMRSSKNFWKKKGMKWIHSNYEGCTLSSIVSLFVPSHPD